MCEGLVPPARRNAPLGTACAATAALGWDHRTHLLGPCGTWQGSGGSRLWGGPRSGRRVRRRLNDPRMASAPGRCATPPGDSRYMRPLESAPPGAAVPVPRTSTGGLGPTAVRQCRDGFTLKTPWADGTTALLLSPQELLEKLSALVPPPRLHLIRYHGVLAPASASGAGVCDAGVARTRCTGITTESNGVGCWPVCSRST